MKNLKKMNTLLFGSGGREHAFSLSFANSRSIDQLYVTPGNAGTSTLATNVNLSPTDYDAVKKFIISREIHLVVIGPEAPLVNGLADQISEDSELSHVIVLGPGAAGAKLEGSKAFAKEFMARHNIPNAAYLEVTADKLEKGLDYIKNTRGPYVLKADGLAAGKGVLIVDDAESAGRELKNMLGGKFGRASEKVVIEEFLEGVEFSVFILTDGSDYVILPEAKDYKRIGEGDTGLNTGGMGAVSPVPFFRDSFRKKVIDTVIEPTVKGLKKDGIDYCGFVFFGLIKVGDDPFVIEYNCRMGDPETQVVFPRIQSDLGELIVRAAKRQLGGMDISISNLVAAAVIAASEGYPEKYEKGKAIAGLDTVKNATVFHAGTKSVGDEILTNGGRVLAITGMGTGLQEALKKSYDGMRSICFEGITYRRDIGKDLL